jgi:prepilin-type N-terminal cleavage/methylation domain-containing protein
MRRPNARRAAWSSNSRMRTRAFTLVEVIVALVVGALVLQSATAITHAIREHSAALHLHVGSMEARRNATRELRTLLQQIDASANEADALLGDGVHVGFTTWCIAPQGWQERCHVSLAWEPDSTPIAQHRVRRGSRRLTLALRTRDRPELIIASNVQRGELRYLASATDGGEWYHTWTTPSVRPLAIALLIDRDTLIFSVGASG